MYNLPKGYLSKSQIEKYLRCPKQYYYSYIEGLPYVPSEDMAVGQVFSVLMQDYNLRKSGKEFELETEIVKTVDEKLDFQKVLSTAKKCFNAYMIKLQQEKLDDYMVLEAEESYIFEVEGIEIMIIPDMIKSNYQTMEDVIVDYKTTGRLKFTEDNLKFDIQTSLYSLGKGIEKVEIHEVTRPRTKKEVIDCNITSVTKTPSQIEDTMSMVFHVAKGISAGDFPKCLYGGWECSEKYCAYWNLCRGKE